MELSDSIITRDDTILLTGSSGFIGGTVLEKLLSHGFRNLRCLVRASASIGKLEAIIQDCGRGANIEIVKGNLLSPEDCLEATRNVAVIYHLAAGTNTSSFPDAFMNSVVTTRNLLDAAVQHKCLRRFVSVSSFSVYTNQNKRGGRLLDESCPVEDQAHLRGDAYCFAKVKQEEITKEYSQKFGIPCVIVRPGVVYGPGKKQLIGRVGIGTFGIFLHLGGSNRIPLTYVENCAEAIVLAGAKKGIDGEIFNVVDDDLPSSRQVLRLYKRNVDNFRSIYVPRWISYLMFGAWEKYSNWSKGQLPAVLNRKTWHAYWKGSNYANDKAKRLLGWAPKVTTAEGLSRYFEYCRANAQHA